MPGGSWKGEARDLGEGALSLWILGVVLVLVAVRRIGPVSFAIWQVMAAGALAVLLTGQISPKEALRAVNADVMVFLFGMFVLGEALCSSGLMALLSVRLFGGAKNVGQLVGILLFSMGLFSALLMNDTVAIIGTPLVLFLARRCSIPPRPLLLALAFAVTIGSVASPIGNPQNLLIALDSGGNPFVTFFRYLNLPTVICLGLAWLVLRLLNPGLFQRPLRAPAPEPLEDPRLARLCVVSLVLVVLLVGLKVALFFAGPGLDFPLSAIAVSGCLPILLFSPGRFRILKDLDWATLAFFAAMFVLMAAAWESAPFQALAGQARNRLDTVSEILAAGVLVSQVVSNVPFVALALPILHGAGVKAAMALAAGSTLAGNLFILGAASNVIIIQNAEKRGETLTFGEFAKAGIPLTAACAGVYGVFLALA